MQQIPFSFELVFLFVGLCIFLKQFFSSSFCCILLSFYMQIGSPHARCINSSITWFIRSDARHSVRNIFMRLCIGLLVTFCKCFPSMWLVVTSSRLVVQHLVAFAGTVTVMLESWIGPGHVLLMYSKRLRSNVSLTLKLKVKHLN